MIILWMMADSYLCHEAVSEEEGNSDHQPDEESTHNVSTSSPTGPLIPSHVSTNLFSTLICLRILLYNQRLLEE